MAETVQEALDALEHYATTVGEQGRRDGDAARIASGDYLLDHILTVRRGLRDQPVKRRPVRDLGDIGRDMVMLAGMLDGLDVLVDSADGDRSDPVVRKARNALVPLVEDVANKAHALATDIERADDAARKGRAG